MDFYVEIRLDEPLHKIRPVDTNMIVLPKMDLSISRVRNNLILVRFSAPFDDGHHDEQHTARSEDPMQLLQSLAVVDVLQHMTAYDHVLLAVETVNIFNVPVSIDVPPEKIRAGVLNVALLYKRCDCRLRREVKEGAV
jgi:hypothetical protein